MLLMMWIIVKSIQILTLTSQESWHGTLGFGIIFWTQGFSKGCSRLGTNGVEESNPYNVSNMAKPLFFAENDVGQTSYRD